MTVRRAVRVVAMASVVALVALLTIVALLFKAMTVAGPGAIGGGLPGRCVSTTVGLGPVQGLDEAQLANARVIIAVGRQMGVPPRGQIIALATAMQESTMRNLRYGDRDSVGLFQQRPSSGWGTVAELTTPEVAARKFYAALVEVSGWQSMPVTVAAQTVQRSAFPLAYAKWEALATAIVQAAGASAGDTLPLDCSTQLGFPAPPGAIGAMLRSALGQQGKPYVWGATGPDSFDCSGLVVHSWRQAGFRSTVRTSQQMWAVSTPVPLGSEQPGDLVFGHFRADGPGHVMIVVKPGLAVQAPRTGDVVKLSSYSSAGGWRVGRLKGTVLRPLSA
jgi:cell wall-associated NlpC family hydrolase